MAQSSAKRTAKDNAQLLQILRYGFLLVHLVHVALRFGLYHSTATGWHVVGYVVNTFGSWWVYRQLSGMPDLSQAGLTQYMFDVVYISWFILLATALISDAFWWTYALIPAYAFFKLWTMVIAPYLRSTYGGGSTGSGPDAGESSATSRRAEKREARGQRPKFQRVH